MSAQAGWVTLVISSMEGLVSATLMLNPERLIGTVSSRTAMVVVSPTSRVLSAGSYGSGGSVRGKDTRHQQQETHEEDQVSSVMLRRLHSLWFPSQEGKERDHQPGKADGGAFKTGSRLSRGC